MRFSLLSWCKLVVILLIVPPDHGVLAMAGAVPDITLLHVIQYPVSSIYMEPITLILILTDGLIFIVRLDIFIRPSQGPSLSLSVVSSRQ